MKRRSWWRFSFFTEAERVVRLAFGRHCLCDKCTADLDDALALVADFDDAVALGSKETTAFKKHKNYGFLSLNPVEHMLRSSTGQTPSLSSEPLSPAPRTK